MVRLIARAPNHLGDGVMAQPAILALAQICDDLIVQAPSWGEFLYPGLKIRPPGPMEAAEIAVLFAPSLRTALQARRVPRRIGLATDYRGALLTDVVVPSLHRAETYARLARAAGATPMGEPMLSFRGAPAASIPEGHVGLVPVSRSGPCVEWRGFAGLAERLEAPVVVYGGPGEEGAVRRALPGAELGAVGLSLPDFARSLSRCRVLIANDSGAAHFARALGVRVVVVYGSTSPDRTGPPGAVNVEGPDPGCRPCYRKRCGRVDLACLRVSVEQVGRAVEQVAPGVYRG